MHTDPVHDLIGTFRKMVFDIVEKDFVLIAGLHEVFSGINVVEHDLGSAAKGCASTPVVMSVKISVNGLSMSCPVDSVCSFFCPVILVPHMFISAGAESAYLICCLYLELNVPRGRCNWALLLGIR